MMTTPNARLRTISMTNYRSNHPLFTQLITRDVGADRVVIFSVQRKIHVLKSNNTKRLLCR